MFDLCERMRDYHGRPKEVRVNVWKAGWRWGPFSGGIIEWDDVIYSVWATPWFSIWFNPRPKK